jgi:hypothetical protein
VTADIVGREDADRAQDDLEAFAELVGKPLTRWQVEALSLRTRQTVILAPRQVGKSYSLSLLACWWAFRKPGQIVLVVSASEDAAGRLLAAVADTASHPLLAGSVDEEFRTRVVLSNGSRILSVPASPKQVRGWSVDLLVVDECAWVDDDLLYSAAIPTTAARPGARLVFASTPWGDGGGFHTLAMDGLDEANPVTRTFTWRLTDAPWITPAAVESARRTLSPLRFRAEYEGEWIGSGDSYFDREDLLAAVADYEMTRDGAGAPAVMGVDWGNVRDRHAVVIAGLLSDFGVNARPVLIVAWCETRQRKYDQQVAEIMDLAGKWSLTIYSERVGVGAAPTEQLAQRLPRTTVIPVFSDQRTKEDAYGRLRLLVEERAIVLPRHEELLRQLAGVCAHPTARGVRIGARTESLHDDLPDALAIAVWGLPAQLAEVPPGEIPGGIAWAETPGGVKVPLPVVTLRPEASYADVYGGYAECARCRLTYPPYKDACQYCGEKNPQREAAAGNAKPRASQGSAAKPDDAVPAGNWWNPDLMRCPADHVFDGRFNRKCPQCRPGGGTFRPGGRFPGMGNFGALR